MNLAPLPGSVTYRSKAGVVRISFAENAGRLEPVGLSFDGPATTDWLRSLPLGRIGAWINGAGRSKLRAVLESGGELAVEAGQRFVKGRRPTLVLPVNEGGRRRPDTFYRRVVELHSYLAAEGSGRPAAEIAEANDVPVTTVHRWMKEARQRGLVEGEA